MKNNMVEIDRIEVFSLVARLAIASAISYFTVKHVYSALDPTERQKKIANKKAKELLLLLGVKSTSDLTDYEFLIASQLVLGEQLHTRWGDIAGLQHVIQDLRETVILPIQQSRRHKSSLIKPPKGVLLHGPPGCGKTLLARAVAREAGCRFINLDVSLLTDKWYGESQKLAGAVFSLATKIQPCIIFVDEVDSFLRVRGAGDHEATAMMKAQFLQRWDGLGTDQDALVVVMAATNRPNDVDRAILRRLPTAFHIKLPDATGREAILRLVLKDEAVADSVDYAALAAATGTFSGSDLRELCRNAAVHRLRALYPLESEELYQDASSALANSGGGGGGGDDGICGGDGGALRAITKQDFDHALLKMRASRVLDLSAAALMTIDQD